MAETASTLHCPECGAPVKSGDKQCWMCFRALEWEGGKVKAATAVPSAFADHPAQQTRTYYRTNPWAIVGLVLAALAMVPAACIAFFVTCLAAFVSLEGHGRATAYTIYPVSFGAAFVVLVGFGILIGILGKRTTRAVRY